MRIGINLLYLLPGVVGGTQTYAMSLIRALVDLDSGDEFRIYVNEESADLEFPDVPNLTVVTCPVKGTRRSARYAYEQLRFPALIAKDNLDVLHSMGYVGPLRTKVPQVVTVHDLIYVGFRDHMSWSRRWALQFFVRGSVKAAKRVIAVSESSRSQILGDINVAPDRVTVVHEAGRELPRDWKPDPEIPGIYGITGPYLVAFSSPSPSKNIPALLDAFATITTGLDQQFDGQLVLVGHLANDSAIADQITALRLQDRVIPTGYVPDNHVMSLVAQARLFVFPSLYEGFGLPVIEAQEVEVPVACSNAASLPEVAGDGAIFFDPTAPAEMVATLRRGLDDEALRTQLIERGEANAARFSWAAAARATHDVYREVATQ